MTVPHIENILDDQSKPGETAESARPATASTSSSSNHSTITPQQYRIIQSVFHGPLDLLLHLVKKNEVDIREVYLAKVADEFLAYIKAMQTLDVEFAGEFLVTAATLMEIKSRSLLPSKAVGEKEIDEDENVNSDLVKQLLEYRKYKDAARALEESADQQAMKMPRLIVEETEKSGPMPVKKVELWDLVAAFGRIVRETQSLITTNIQVDDTPQHVYEEMVLAKLRQFQKVKFRSLFTPPYTKARLIGLFLAILELIKGQKILLSESDEEIWLTISALEIQAEKITI